MKQLIFFIFLFNGLASVAQRTIYYWKDGIFTKVESVDSLTNDFPCRKLSAVGKYEAVDLGLSVKWATYNIGASKETELGDYFAWGETQKKASYTWDNYKFYNSVSKITKYCTNSSFGNVDGLTTLDMTDDAAHILWGDNWRIPTKAEQEELINNCNAFWITSYDGSGVPGYLLFSKKPGFECQYIFLPVTGYKDDNNMENISFEASYWSSTLSDVDDDAFEIYLTQTQCGVRRLGYRSHGESIRAVCK